jgi:hypothetical protein
MNRIILIGNGFDLAHGLKTSYNDFIDDFWEQKANIFQKAFHSRDLKFLSQENPSSCEYQDKDIAITNFLYHPMHIFDTDTKQQGFRKFTDIIIQLKKISPHASSLSIKNKLLSKITYKKELNWVDIEEEYYYALIEFSNNKNDDIDILNNEFLMIQTPLENYLKSLDITKVKKTPQIEQKIYAYFPPYDVVAKIPAGVGLDNFLYLNFNYTNT